MGLLYKNVCYPTQEQARAASCSDVTFTYVAPSSTTTVVTTGNGSNALSTSTTKNTTVVISRECNSASTSASMSICSRIDGGNCSSVTAPWPVFPVCGHDCA
jgi:3-hydroxyisobutyrate dehydrogenase-like beta-hydroxyacid dehydrogenase